MTVPSTGFETIQCAMFKYKFQYKRLYLSKYRFQYTRLYLSSTILSQLLINNFIKKNEII